MRPARYVLVRSSAMILPAHARSNRKQSLADCLDLVAECSDAPSDQTGKRAWCLRNPTRIHCNLNRLVRRYVRSEADAARLAERLPA